MRSGAGKTTAVRILATLLRPDGGHARVCGHDVVSHAHQVRQLTGLTGQYASVDESLTGTENLMLIGRLTEPGDVSGRRVEGELVAGRAGFDAGFRKRPAQAGDQGLKGVGAPAGA
jgi:ABC-type multidrug transport system ATPase subunit